MATLALNTSTNRTGQSTRGSKFYELSNHLGNVPATVSDMKLGYVTSLGQTTAEGYKAQVQSASDYYPFGWAMSGRQYSAGEYRFGFNGKENDTHWGDQLIQDYGFRLYNPAVAKFLSVDPLSPQYPELTPYQFASNTPIQAIDLDGLEAYYLSDGTWGGQVGNNNTVMVIPAASAVGQNIQTQIAQANRDPRSARWLQRQAMNLGMNHNVFQDFAGALYQETSGSGVVTSTEAAAMYSLLENRANIPGHGTVYDELRAPGQVNGYANYQNNATIVNAVNNEEGVPAYAQNKMNTVREGIIEGILSNYDYSEGAYFWDGNDFADPNRAAYQLRYLPGYNFTESGHDIHELGNNPVDKKKMGYTYMHESTVVHGHTTFSRLTDEWRNAAKPNGTANEMGQ